MSKLEALAKHLEIELEEGETLEDYLTEVSEIEFSEGSREYLVMTDAEADASAQDCIADTLWAFNADFLAEFTGLPEEVFTALQTKCEDANDTFASLIEKCGEGIEEFAREAIAADGREHFMRTYDDKEYEIGGYFIYRMN